MGLRLLSADNVAERAIADVGLDPTVYAIGSSEVLSALIRRAAGFLCPCSSRSLVDTVTQSLNGLLVDSEGDIRECVQDAVDVLLAHGDLIEQQSTLSDAQDTRILIYIAPPSFVRLKSGTIILLGLVPDHISFLPDDLETEVVVRQHIRYIPGGTIDNLPRLLTGLGCFEVPLDAWIRAPQVTAPEAVVRRHDVKLDAASPSGDVPGLRILDPTRPVRYYRGRWTAPDAQTGRFVGRRSQLYGADLWCYTELKDGKPLRFVDLPVFDKARRGCDEAWYLQAAFDFLRGKPQCIRLRKIRSEFTTLDVFSPVPSWLNRRWEAVGVTVDSQGCLLSYEFRDAEADTALQFATERLWLHRCD